MHRHKYSWIVLLFAALTQAAEAPNSPSATSGTLATAPASGPAGEASRTPPASLKTGYRDKFTIGVALGGNLPGDYSPEELTLVRAQFGCITPENCMKMQELQPREGQFDFRQADALVDFAQRNGMKVCGHTLLWAKDERTPGWIFIDGDKPASRERLLQRLRTHIQTVAGRYRGKIAYWDVVNEALDDGQVLIRPSQWEKLIGPDFMAKAFEYAREADPNAILIYNDYNTDLPSKREKMLRLLQDLKERKAPVHAVGLQGHWEIDHVPYQDIEQTLVAIKGMGLKVMITEMDIGVVPRGRWWADGGKYREELSKYDPYPKACPQELLDRQAQQYGELFRLFVKHADAIERVTFWDLHDGRSWLNAFPWKHAEYPLLFDRSCNPKPAFDAVLAATRG
jgi:endo-1,4-beta-xylanase